MTWFAILAQLAPAELVQDPWEAQWSAWLDDAREALGQALGLIPPGPQSARAADLGLLLVMDPCYAVRRAAYRSLAIHAPDSLRGFVEVGMSTETPTALRRRAAEAAEWVDVTPGQLAALAADPELDVREAARAAERSARRRVWVDDYMGTVLSAAREGGDAVLGAWRHGAALAQLGDDGTLRQLRQRAQDPQIEPHARYWLGHLSQQLETRWRKAMIEWPQPWEQYDGAIEQGDGTLSKDGEATVVRVRYFLWQSPGDHVKLPSWGGTISSFGEEAWPPGGASIVKPGEAELTLQDGQRKGRVWCGLPVMPRGRHPVDGVETYPA
ncbi:MAG: hypothetical protein HYU66_08930 [Armatimonadetes bacterium]|nr:hypothetical protein [Armatimonadota bacterium]